MEITLFKFNGAELRCITKDGEPWFIAKDVCSTFGDSDHKRSVSKIDDDDKQLVEVKDSMGRIQMATAINESGLYAILFAMQPEKARLDGGADVPPHTIERISRLKKFKKWVTSEVLPAIRKTGAYSMQPVEFKLPANMAEALRLAADSIERAEVAETKLLEAAPKVEFFDTVTKSNTVVTMAVAAQTAKLPFGQNILYRKLREMGVLISTGSRYNLPKQQYIEQGLFTVNEHKFERTNGEVDVNFTTHVTQKGIAWISGKMKEAQP